MEAIKLENVILQYKTIEEQVVTAVDNLSLSIEAGQFIAIVGHNGCGKSSLAKLMNGLLLPQKGKVTVFGIDTADKKTVFEVRKNVGMVFQNPDNQMIASIVEDDIAFGPENIGLPREEIVKRVDWALEKVGMSEHKKATPFRMSGGQKQRLAIAGVLAMKPKVIVLDESTAMLDPMGRKEVLKVVKDLNEQEGMTVILITHYMEEAIDADRVLVMSKGSIIADGAPREIFGDVDKLMSAHLTMPAVTDIALKLKDCGLNLPSDIIHEEELIKCLTQLLQ